MHVLTHQYVHLSSLPATHHPANGPAECEQIPARRDSREGEREPRLTPIEPLRAVDAVDSRTQSRYTSGRFAESLPAVMSPCSARYIGFLSSYGVAD